jgi:hypothetical protein
MTQFFDVAMARLKVRQAKLTHASLVDMLEKLTAIEAKEKEEEEERERGGEEERKKKEAWEETRGRMATAAEKLHKKLIAKKAAKKEEEEKQAPPWHTYISERVLMMRGVTGHNKESLQDIVMKTIGRDIPFHVRMVSGDTLATITLRNKAECTEALDKLSRIYNPNGRTTSRKMTCIRAKYKEKPASGQRDWDDIRNRWATPQEMSKGSTRDKGTREGEEVSHDEAEHTRNEKGKEEEEREPSISQPAKEEEEPRQQEYTADIRADSPVPDETWEHLADLKTNYPVYWMNLMRYETSFLTNEEALQEVREEARKEKAGESQPEMPRERRSSCHTARRQEGQDTESQGISPTTRARSPTPWAKRVRDMKAASASPQRIKRKR